MNVKFAAALSAAALCSSAVFADVVLVENSAARAEVVVPSDAWDVESYAADEFVHFLKKSTGVELPVVHAGEEAQCRAKVLIGRAAALDPQPDPRTR